MGFQRRPVKPVGGRAGFAVSRPKAVAEGSLAVADTNRGADWPVERGLFIVVFPIRSATMVVFVLVQPSHFRE